jgi:hypothetical protein
MLKCDNCGRFMVLRDGASWKLIYSGVLPEPDHEIYRCCACVAKLGPFTPQYGIKPECSCGVVTGKLLA